MTDTKEKSKNKENKNEYPKNETQKNGSNNLLEKKIIVYLIMVSLILLFYAQFYIHDIIDRAIINTSQGTTITYPEKKDNDDNTKNRDDTINNRNKDNNGNNNDKKDDNDKPIVDAKSGIKILQNQTEWKELKYLDIFKENNGVHVAEDKIAPGVQGIYAYTVENYEKATMKYNMTYKDENPYNINMLYKLRINGNYVAGNKEKWVSLEELNQTDLIINGNTTDIFILEWRWEDSSNDTQIGQTEGANYKIYIDFYAEQI